MAAKRSKGGRRPVGVMLGVALLMLGLGLGLGWFFRGASAPRPQPEAPQAVARKPRTGAPRGGPAVPESRKATEPQAGAPARAPEGADPMPTLALVIDDLGYAPPELVTRLCAQPVPFTVAVLPFLEHSQASAQLARERGKEVILHLPMEPLGYPGPGKNPGPGAILHAMDEGEVRRKVREALLAVPGVKGVNNHMGSRITPDTTRMGWILEEVKARRAYFLDSRTEKDTVALEVARRLGIRSVQRKVFLDDSKDFAEMERQWHRALALAEKEGEVVIIGHIYPETVSALERLVPRAKGQVQFVTAGSLAR